MIISASQRSGRVLPAVAGLAPLAPVAVSTGLHVTKETLRYLAPYLVENTWRSQIGKTVRGWLPEFLGGDSDSDETTPAPQLPPVEINVSIDTFPYNFLFT